MKERDSLVAEIEALENRARSAGLFITMRALNQAKNACGWELAGNATAAICASRGERAGADT